MISSVLSLRLQHLEANIRKILELLNQYEIELFDNNDPGVRSRYRRRIEELKQQKLNFESELTELQSQLTNEQFLQTQTITSQLQIIDNKIEIIDNKIDLLLDNQSQLNQVLLSYFDQQEQILLLPFTEKLDESQLLQISASLEAVDKDKFSKDDIDSVLLEIRNTLKYMNRQNPLLPESSKALWGIIDDPKIDAKHSLKVTIPIIPFILNYEAELALGTNSNLREI
jgi:hypothetical protein